MLNLAIEMQKYAIALDHLGYWFDLDAVHSMEGIIRYLPLQSLSRWEEEA